MHMPNWCSHTISVSGPERLINRLELDLRARDAGTGEWSLLELLLPMPAELVDTVSPGRAPHAADALEKASAVERAVMTQENLAYEARNLELTEQWGASNWYDWRIAHWGVKWPDRNYDLRRKPRSFQMRGECPWAPPLVGLRQISNDCPQLRISIRFSEPGMGFRGRAAYQRGEVLYEHWFE